jgi:hypothetical protein
MKIRALSVLVLCLISPLAGWGQTPARRVLRPPVAQDSSTPSPVLTENYRITLKVTQDDKTVQEIVMTGLGPRFLVKTVDPVTSIQVELEKKDDSFLVAYNIEEQIKVATSPTGNEFRAGSVNGTVRLQAGKPVVIASENGRKYRLEIEPAKDTADAKP